MTDSPWISLSTKSELLVVLMLAGLFAGCVDDGADECVEGVCTTTKAGDVFVTNATRQAGIFDPCWGVILFNQVPEGTIASEAPDAFDPDGMFPGTETFDLLALECDRITFGNVVATDVHMMYTAAAAKPKDPDWSTGYASRYVFEMLVDHQPLTDALADAGLPMNYASFNGQLDTSPYGSHHAWTFATDSIGFEFNFAVNEDGQGRGNGQIELWTGGPEYVRTDVNFTNEAGFNAGLTPSVLTMQGDTAFTRMMGTDVLPMGGQVAISRTYDWRPYPRLFIE